MGFVKEFNMCRPTIYPVFDELSLDILFVISTIHRAYPYIVLHVLRNAALKYTIGLYKQMLNRMALQTYKSSAMNSHALPIMCRQSLCYSDLRWECLCALLSLFVCNENTPHVVKGSPNHYRESVLSNSSF